MADDRSADALIAVSRSTRAIAEVACQRARVIQRTIRTAAVASAQDWHRPLATQLSRPGSIFGPPRRSRG
jgi:hypothetical protein